VGCTSGGGAAVRPGDDSAPPAAEAELLRECPLRGDLLCGTIEVPLDRAEPEGETIPIAFYVHLHTAEPAAEPVFVTPGGPG